MSSLSIIDFIGIKTILNKRIGQYCDGFMAFLEKNPHKKTLTKNILIDKVKEFYHYKIHKPRFDDFSYILNFLEIHNFFNNPFCQGVSEYIEWNQKPMAKTVEDFSLYTMLLQEINPSSVIELGTGNGNFTSYMKDILKDKTKIMSFDINGNHYFCDSKDLSTFDPYTSDFNNLKHPILFIEDVHVNTFNNLEYFFQYSTPGCYFVIEDCSPKSKLNAVKKWFLNHKEVLAIDTKYTGMFGTFNTIVVKHLKAKI